MVAPALDSVKLAVGGELPAVGQLSTCGFLLSFLLLLAPVFFTLMHLSKAFRKSREPKGQPGKDVCGQIVPSIFFLASEFPRNL